MSAADERAARYLRLVDEPASSERNAALLALAGEQLAATRDIQAGPDEARVVDEACAALARAPELYQRAGQLVEVVVEDTATRGLTRACAVPRILPCAEPRIRELLAREATWWGPDGGGGRKRIHPPQWAVRAVLARGQWSGVRPIVTVATAPTMRLDGSILARPGYDDATGIYMAPSVEVQVAELPTIEDAKRSIDILLDVIADFPAATPAAKSAWLAGLLSVVARPAIDGPVPMVIIDATVRGSGKSMLVDVAALIATGRVAARMIYSGDDAEMRKTITAVLIAGDPIVALDNVVGELGCASLDAVLTGETWRDRILGVSAMTAEIPIRIAWYATGNGLVIGADLSRRALLVRLEPGVERPEERTGWRHPRLLDHVRDHRAMLLGAALTVARAYHVAGRPDMDLRPMGSYDRWSDLARSAVVWAGLPDPCDTIMDLRQNDVRTDALRAVVMSWPAPDYEPVTAAHLLRLAGSNREWRAALTEWCPPKSGSDLPSGPALGMALRGIRGRILGGHRIQSAGRNKLGAMWIRDQVGSGDGGAHGDGAQPPTRTTRSCP